MPRVLKAVGMKKCIGCFTCMLMCASVNHQNHSISRSAIKVKSIGGLTNGFDVTVCHACTGERACMEVCPSGALEKRKGGGVVFNKDLCIGCRKCQAACIVGAVSFDGDMHEPIICKQCGICARFCPHGCLIMEETEDVL
ncbi:MAG: 4Fe-4S dicluster domain-containing protein [Saccharofermentanales bacterium]